MAKATANRGDKLPKAPVRPGPTRRFAEKVRMVTATGNTRPARANFTAP